MPNVQAVVRDEDSKTLGIVSDRYRIINNSEAFAFTSSIFDSNEITFERGGSYRGGRATWIQAKVTTEYSILGDDTTCYIILLNTHDGSGSIKALIMPTRIVCSNALNFALNHASRIWRCPHTQDISARVNEAREFLLNGTNYMKALEEEAERLNKKKLSETEVESMVSFLFPILPDATERIKKARQETREQFLTVYKEKEDLQNFDQNAYRFLSAVVDYVAHRDLPKKTETGNLNRYLNIAQGNPLIDKAYNLVK